MLSPPPSQPALNRHFRLARSSSWTMAPPNQFLFPMGCIPRPGLLFFAFPRTRESPPLVMPPLRSRTPRLSPASRVGVCYTRTLPQEPDPLLTRWRMRFQEPAYPEQSGPTPFAHGHAVLFRKEALDAVGGYDVRFRRHHEDSDISQRMKTAGWESHYVAGSRCISIQRDSLQSLAIKQLRDSGWYSPQESSLFRLYFQLSKWTFIRAARNLLKGRLYFLPVDVAIWARALWFATSLTLRS
jgi:hypothetical protein